MVPDSPADALGSHALGLRDLLVEIVRARHGLAAEAHLVSESRYAMGFGSQWRDLLDDTREALKGRGFRSIKLAPGGHEVPVVNDSLVYVWRMANNPKAVSEFASSPTRKNGFMTAPLDPTLWEPSLTGEPEPVYDASEESELGPVLRAVGDTMPLVLRAMSGHVEVSFSRAICRDSAKPNVGFSDAGKRSCDSGMRNSALHPSARLATTTSHTASQP